MSGKRIFFDTEFIEDGRTIELLSIGLAADDGATYYAEIECDKSTASPWVRENVLPFLKGPERPKDEVAREIVRFAGLKPEFWAYYGDYDWVALCQMFGTMMDLPPTWPMYCRDLKQVLDEQGIDSPPAPDDEHHALVDAKWGLDVLESIGGIPTRRDYEELLAAYERAIALPESNQP